MEQITAATCGCAVRVHRCDRRALVCFQGDLCEDTVPWACGWVLAELLRDIDGLVIDLDEVDLLSAAGVTLLAWAQRRAEQAGFVVQLRRPRPQVRCVLEMCGLAPLLDDEACATPETARRRPAVGAFRPARLPVNHAGPRR